MYWPSRLYLQANTYKPSSQHVYTYRLFGRDRTTTTYRRKALRIYSRRATVKQASFDRFIAALGMMVEVVKPVY